MSLCSCTQHTLCYSDRLGCLAHTPQKNYVYPSLCFSPLLCLCVPLFNSFHLLLYSRAWPYAVGCVRTYAVATEQKEEISVEVRSKQAQQFDWALNKLDTSVRRTGRITKNLLLRIFHDICRTGRRAEQRSGRREAIICFSTLTLLFLPVCRLSQWKPGLVTAA